MTRSGTSASMRSVASLAQDAVTTSKWRAARARSMTRRTLTLSSTTRILAISAPLHPRRAGRPDVVLVDVRGHREQEPLDGGPHGPGKSADLGGVDGDEGELTARARRAHEGRERPLALDHAVLGVDDPTVLEDDGPGSERQRQAELSRLGAEGEGLGHLGQVHHRERAPQP